MTGRTAAELITVRRWAGAVVIALALAWAGTVLGWRLAGPSETQTELGRVSFEVAPHLFGVADVFVPIADWGLRADAFDSVFALEVEVRAIDRQGAVTAATGSGNVLSGLETDLRDGARRAVVRALLWGFAGAFGCAALWWLAVRQNEPLRRVAYLALVTAAGIAGGSAAWTTATFDSRAFADPSYYGRGAELSQLLAFLERQRGNDRYTSGFENALVNFTAYLSESARPGEQPGQTFVFGSDLHNNALILPALSRFARDQPVLLAGDFGHEGDEAEARLIVPRLAQLSEHVVVVSGNHDSATLMRALADEGVVVLTQDGRLRANGEVGGSPLIELGRLTIAGFSDPLEWRGADPNSPERVFSFAELDDGSLLEQRAKEDLYAWFQALPEKPDIVLVHQNALGQHLASELAADGYPDPLVIVTGHNHYQHLDRRGRIVVVNAGTLGAGGALRVGQEAAGLGRLHLVGAERTLQSLDLIEIEPLSGQASADRVVVDLVCPPAESSTDSCHYEPERP